MEVCGGNSYFPCHCVDYERRISSCRRKTTGRLERQAARLSEVLTGVNCWARR